MKIPILFAFLIHVIQSKIVINVEKGDNDQSVSITYSGVETSVANDEDTNSFFAGTDLRSAVRAHSGVTPKNVYFKKPTPWGDLYTTYNWEQVTKLISVKSARVKSYEKHPRVVLMHDFENSSNRTIKVNTGISHTIENTLTTSWSKSKEFTVSQELEYDINVIFAKLAGTTEFSYTSTLGQSEEKSETMTIGSTSTVETELQPGQSCTAELSVDSGYMEIEITYKTSLRGNLAVNYRRQFNGHHFWGPLVQDVMKSAGVKNENTLVETVKFGFHIDARLRVVDKASGLPL